MKTIELGLSKEVLKAYQEGIYADTPSNRKLGRVGMTYTAYAEKLKKEKDNKEGKTWNKQEDFFKEGSDEKKLWDSWYKFQKSGDPSNISSMRMILEKKFPKVSSWKQTTPNTGKAELSALNKDDKEIAKIDLSGNKINLTKLQTFMDKCYDVEPEKIDDLPWKSGRGGKSKIKEIITKNGIIQKYTPYKSKTEYYIYSKDDENKKVRYAREEEILDFYNNKRSIEKILEDRKKEGYNQTSKTFHTTKENNAQFENAIKEVKKNGFALFSIGENTIRLYERDNSFEGKPNNFEVEIRNKNQENRKSWFFKKSELTQNKIQECLNDYNKK